jgi:hypothetical protein
MTTNMQALKNAAAHEMARESRLDYDYCKDLTAAFLADASAEQLYRLEIDPRGAVQSRKAKNIFYTVNNADVLEFAEAITMLVGATLAESPIEKVLGAMHAGLWFTTTFQKLTTIKLSSMDAAVILAMHRLGGKSLALDSIEDEWRAIGQSTGLPEEELSRATLVGRLSILKGIRCITENSGGWEIAETVEYREPRTGSE